MTTKTADTHLAQLRAALLALADLWEEGAGHPPYVEPQDLVTVQHARTLRQLLHEVQALGPEISRERMRALALRAELDATPTSGTYDDVA